MSTEPTLSASAAEEIQVMLVRRRMNKSALARQLGVSHTWVSNRLSGQQEIGLNELQQIARVLGVEVTELLPRPMPGRVLTQVGQGRQGPNDHSANLAKRTRHKRRSQNPRPIGGPRRDQPAPASPVTPTQRRPMLSSAPGQPIPA